mgnify:CR=1 FL=1
MPGGRNKKADCLSRLPMSELHDDVTAEDDEDEECLVASVRWLDQVCVSEEEWRSNLGSDQVLQTVLKYVIEGWPGENSLPFLLQPFSKIQSEISVEKGILFRGDYLVSPIAVRETLIFESCGTFGNDFMQEEA